MNLHEKLVKALVSKEVVTISGMEFAKSVDIIKSPTLQRDHAKRVESGKVDYFSVFRPLAHDNVQVGYYTGPTDEKYTKDTFYLIDGNTRRHFYINSIVDNEMAKKFPSVLDIMELPFYLRVVEFSNKSEIEATYNCFDNPDQMKTASDNMYSAAKLSGINNTNLFEKLASCINKLTRLEGKRKQFQLHNVNDIDIRNVQVKLLGGPEKIEEAMDFATSCNPEANASENQRLIMFFFYTEKEENKNELRKVLINAYQSDNAFLINEKSSKNMSPMDYLATVIKLGSKTALLSCVGGNSSILYADVMLHACKQQLVSSEKRKSWDNYDFNMAGTYVNKEIKGNFDKNIRTTASFNEIVEMVK